MTSDAHCRVRSSQDIQGPTLSPGPHTLRYEFVYGGDIPMGGGTGTLYVDDEKVAEGAIAYTVPALFSADETADVGVDHHTPVTPAYAQRGNDFNGEINKVVVDLK